MHKGYTTPLVIAIMAFAIVSFLFLIDTAINPDGSKKTTNTASKNTNVTVSNQNTNASGVNTNSTVLANNNTNEHTDNGTADPDPTADWKTYASKQYGLTFKYPTTWVVEEGTLNGPYSVFAHPKESPETPSLRFWLDKAYDGLSTPSGTKTTTSKNVTYAGRSAALSKTITPANELLIAHVQFTTTPSGWGSDSTISLTPDNAGSIEIPLQIMETLTIADPTAGWKTYTNTVYKYSLKHSSDYRVTLTPNGNSSILFEKGEPGYAGYTWITVASREDSSSNSTNVAELFAWAKQGFPTDDPITLYHSNPRNITLGENTFMLTDGDRASSGYPEYLVYHNNILYHLLSSADEKDQQSIREIISTFTFTD